MGGRWLRKDSLFRFDDACSFLSYIYFLYLDSNLIYRYLLDLFMILFNVYDAFNDFFSVKLGILARYKGIYAFSFDLEASWCK